jgi:mono/diheme cytochrome c family protein
MRYPDQDDVLRMMGERQNRTQSMNQRRVVILSVCVILLAGSPACSQGEPVSKSPAGPAPAEFQVGEAKFTANCAACHGRAGVGTGHGPPLVHKIYEPNHHGDAAFQRAAANGVSAHHWEFGNMPRIDSVTPEDVDQIVRYVRWLQRQADIY